MPVAVNRPGPGTDPPSVVVVDDHPVVRSGVGAWCAAAGITVLASGPTPDVAWQEPGAGADVVVFDLQLAGRAGPAWDDLARLADAGRRVVVHTMRDDERTALRCLDLGCATVVTKAEGERHLVTAVLAAAGDRPCVPPALAGAMGVDAAADRPQLTDREREVLLLWFQCESKRTVAQRLGLSPRTVEGYLNRVRVRYARAGRPAATKAGLVARALQDGLVELDDM